MIRIIIAGIFFLLGLFLFVTEVIGFFKFKYVMNRMHAAALGDTFGLLFIVLGVIVLRGFTMTSLKMLLIPAFFMLTGPVLTHLIGKVEVMDYKNKTHEYKEENRK